MVHPTAHPDGPCQGCFAEESEEGGHQVHGSDFFRAVKHFTSLVEGLGGPFLRKMYRLRCLHLLSKGLQPPSPRERQLNPWTALLLMSQGLKLSTLEALHGEWLG